MNRIRAIIVYFLVLFAEGGLIFQAKEPTKCTGTIYIMLITGGNQLNKVEKVRQLAHVTVGVICLIACIGLLLMAIDLIGGKSKGLLKFAYIFMGVYYAIQIAACIMIYTMTGFIRSSAQTANLFIYLVSEIILFALMFIWTLRELGLIRVIDKLSTVLLLAIIGQIVSNGFLAKLEPKMLVFGLITALPTIAIFVFEAFILEASIRRLR